MIEHTNLTHHIQKHIIGILMYKATARFSELRPSKTDTNLFSYHLKLLVKTGFIAKNEAGYSLSQKGLAYVDRVSSEKMNIRTQPKIITMLVIQDSDGNVLLQKRTKQPYIGLWTLPYGKIHIEDESILSAAEREVSEKLGLFDQKLRHAGECYIRVRSEGAILSTTLAHVFRFETDDINADENHIWIKPHKFLEYELAPAVEQIVTRSFFGDDYFFEEYTEDFLV